MSKQMIRILLFLALVEGIELVLHHAQTLMMFPFQPIILTSLGHPWVVKEKKSYILFLFEDCPHFVACYLITKVAHGCQANNLWCSSRKYGAIFVKMFLLEGYLIADCCTSGSAWDTSCISWTAQQARFWHCSPVMSLWMLWCSNFQCH